MEDLTPKYPIVPARDKIQVFTPEYELGDLVGGWMMGSDELTKGQIKLQGTAERILLGLATEPLTGVGIFIGKDASDYEWRVGDPSGNYIHYDGTDINVVGGVITGGTIQTAASGKRIVMASNVMEFYNVTPTNIASFNGGALGSTTFLYISSPVGAPFNPVTILQAGESATGAVFIQCSDSGAGTICADLLQQGDKSNLNLRNTNTSSGIALDIDNDGIGNSIDISASGASGKGINIALTNVSNNDEAIRIVHAGTGKGLFIQLSLAASGSPGIEIDNDGGGRGLYIHNDKVTSSARGIYVANAGIGIPLVLEALNATADIGQPVISIVQNSIYWTNFKLILDLAGKRIWLADGTTPDGNLSGVIGDLCMNGPSGQAFYCTGTTNWTGM